MTSRVLAIVLLDWSFQCWYSTVGRELGTDGVVRSELRNCLFDWLAKLANL